MWTPPSSTWTHVEMSEIVSWSTAPQTATLPFLYFSALFFLLGCPWRCFLQLSLDPHSFFKFFIPPHFHISCFAFLLLSFHFSLLSPDLLLLLTLSHFPFIPTAHFSPLPISSSHSGCWSWSSLLHAPLSPHSQCLFTSRLSYVSLNKTEPIDQQTYSSDHYWSSFWPSDFF